MRKITGLLIECAINPVAELVSIKKLAVAQPSFRPAQPVRMNSGASDIPLPFYPTSDNIWTCINTAKVMAVGDGTLFQFRLTDE